MATSAYRSATLALSKGGASLVDLLVDAPEVRVVVTGPGMLYDHLVLLTTLTPADGCNAHRVKELAASLEGTVHCGAVGVHPAEISVTPYRAGVLLRIGLGPANMYQSTLVLRTHTDETFRELLTRLLSDDPERPFFAGLHGVPATGHLEHHHSTGGGGHDHHGRQGGSGHGHP
ncbi:hypothetical protein Stsp02_26560 [Streptomyces sp. NBRC 14336]|jgi:hypothetical protein|uniref:hypothetical protein n=1 Tax=Streptomyces sp. NBRC 14336 TaxID=3030992 RepID=UPI0024A3EC01|nr:hypothetical protein [Streptomyces sp. NBRC 14336]WBO76382.1 hypothetical protein SBE_007150 [Streptomyces sp. SBE_14.2]GLW46994.1 hypothetical protein Stsp02_26560 [Streptomyces sp. NBRC 14336]